MSAVPPSTAASFMSPPPTPSGGADTNPMTGTGMGAGRADASGRADFPFEIVGVSSRLLLDGVYMNGIHALRRLDLRNTSGERLRIRLQSNLGAQIAFQLSNENLPEERAHEAAETVATGTDDTASGIAAMTTTLASAASGPTAEGSRVMTTSQSLASLASLDSEPSVTSGGPTALAPSLFLHRRAVATNTAHAAALNLAMRASARTADTATTSAYHQCNELFNYVNYIDSVDLEKAETKSIVLAFLPEPKQVNSNNAEAMSPSTADASYEMSEYNGTLSFLVTRIDRDGVERDTRRGGDAADLPRPTTYTIKFRSKVCRSVLASSVAETGIAFDDCVAGVAYHKDFTVWNRSEIDLYFTVAITGLADTAHENWFTITDYDSGERIDMKAVPAFSYRRIRMTLLASEPADIGAELIIENINDLNNVETVPLQAVVRSVLHEESLVVTSGHVVDFGDCYTGSWSRQPITIKNIANVPLEVSFHAEHIPGTVSFDLRSDDVKENAGEPGVTTSAPTVTSALSDRAPTRASGRTSAGDSVWVDATAALVRSTAVSVSSSRNSSPSRGERAPSGGDSRSASSLDFLDEMQIGRADSRSSLMRLTGTGTGGGRESTNPYETSQSRSRRSGDNSGTQIEELLLPPGTERTITICFRMDGKERISGTLEKVSFKVSLAYAPLADMPVTKQYKRIACRARVCTSLISITPNELNFGDVDVGTLKSLPVRITNLADLTANVELRYDSKILNCSRGEISIAPRQSQEVKIDIYPRKVNPEYRKPVVIVNLCNRDNDQTLMVCSNNIDKNRVTFHSLFYRILTPNSTNFIDYGTVIMNNPTVRLFTVENISKKRLRVGIASSLPDELQIFSIDKAAPIARSEAPRVPVVGSSAAATEAGSTDYLDLASSIQAASGREGGSKNSPARPPSRAKQAQRLVSRHGADRGITALAAATGTSATPTEIPSTTAVDFSRAFPNFDEDDEKSTGKNLKAGGDEPAASGDFSDNDQLSSALQQSAFGTRKSHDVTPASLQMLLNSLESASKHSMIFGKQASEERYLKAVLAMNKMLTKSRANGKLVPVTSLDMAPDSSEVLALVFTPSSTLRPYIQGKPKKLDAKILLRLLEFDRDATQAPEFEALLNAELESIPVREFIIRAALCRSLMEIGQRHINFGLMEKREQRSKTIVIYNRADVPLLYAIRKTGSIASGDLNFDGGRLGIVRGLGKREVKFTFTPSMPGNFLEKITIENLQDPENTQTVGVKAQIRKPSTFFVKSLDMDFGVFLANESTHSMQQIVITNTSKQTRTFELLVLAKDLVFGQCYGEMFFDAVDSVAHQPWSKETEEEIEHLEQKLKIAIRKGQDDKVKKVTERLGKLKGVGSVTTPSDGPSQSRVEVDTAAPNAPTTISSSSSTAQLPKRPSSSSGRRLRTTDKGVVFSIDSLATITINVYLRIMSDARATDDNDRSMERCRGELVVNELRNADSAKTIRFQIMTCFDYAAYVHALEGHAPDLRMLSNDAIAASRPASPRMSRNASAFQVTAPCMTASTVTSPLGTPAVATALMGLATILKPLEVCPAILDLGKIELSASSSYYLMLNNPSEKSIEYFVRVPSDSRIILKEPPRGRVGPLESKRVYFSLRPSDFGKQTDALVIVDRTNRVEVEFTVAYHALQNRYLVFDGLAVTGDIDFGVCYLDSSKQYCKSIAIAVRNASTEPIFVAVRSNLVQQLYLFSDRELKCPLSRFQLDIDQVQRIYLAIQPNVTAAALKNGDCRELVGGLKFSVSSVVTDPTTSTPVENEFLVSQTIRFVALVGESTIETSVTDFDFGVATALDTFEGHFVVSNVCYREMVDSSSFVTQRHLSTQPSQYLPLEVEIQCPDSVIVSEKAITLYGTDATSTSSAKIDFSLSPKTWGLFEEEIRLLNLHNPGQVRIISLRVFIDPGLLIIRPQRKTNLFASVEYVQYYWPQLYVNAIDSEPRVVCVDGGGDDKLITVTNDSDRPLIFDVMSPPFVEFALATKTGAVGMDQSMRQSANRIALEPGETIPLRMLAHAPKSFRSYEVKALRRGAPAIARGMVRLVEIGSGGTIGVIKLMANFYLARAQIEPPLMDLGRLGLSGRLEDVPIKFAIKNVTDAPFPFELPDEGAIEITAVFCRNRLLLVAGQHALVIPPRETFDVEARLKAHKLEFVSSAVQTFEFTMKNLGNPREPLRISFKASISMLQLQFGRLTNGELVLPPLQIPQPAEATPCDAWFTIVNTSNEDARFEVGLDLAPELSDMFSVEVLSRFSNAKLKGVITLCAQGVLEVKVRAAIKAESRRLSEVSQNITSPDGVALGRLRVAVRLPGGGDDASSVCEDVPLRGTFIEGPPFVLSKQRIEFRCAPEPDSSDHESDDEGNGRSSKEPPSSRQVAADDMHTSTSHTADVVKIMNLSPAYPLVFRVQQELPPALKDSDYIKVSPIDKEGMGTVPPGGTLELSVELSRVTPAGSFDIKLHIEDANAIARRKEVVVIAVSSEAPRRRHPTATTIFSQTTAPARSDDHAPKSEEPIAEQPIATLSASPMKSALSVQALEEKMSSNRVKIPIGPGIALRGCKQMSFRGSGGAAANGTGLRYEIDVGQQDVGAGTVTRILILENEATRPSRYRIRTTFSGVERAEPWLTLSKTEGLLDPRPDNGRDVGNETENVVQRSSLGLGETHIQQVHVFLSCTTEGCYTAYLFIENEDNPADTKLIRVTMEVVSTLNTHDATEERNFFDVVVSGVDPAADRIEMHGLFYNTEHSTHSFLIRNNGSVPLEFFLKHNLPEDGRSEMLFSLHRSSARLFRTLVVEPHSAQRVYLRLYLDLSDAADSSTGDGGPCLHRIEAYINCRLVKDFQKQINIDAYCRRPSLRLSSSEFRFDGSLSKQVADASREAKQGAALLSMEPADGHQLAVTNVCDHAVPLLVVNDTRFFSVAQPALPIARGATVSIDIALNADEIRDNLAFLQKLKYVEETLVVYNQLDSTEKFYVTLRISLGKTLFHFYMVSASKSTFAYNALEYRVVEFLRNVNAQWPVLAGVTSLAEFHVQPLLFQFAYIVDTLVYAGTRDNVGENYLHLGSLLFRMLLEGERLTGTRGAHITKDGRPLTPIGSFICGLSNFLSVFPQRSHFLDQLRTIRQKILASPGVVAAQ